MSLEERLVAMKVEVLQMRAATALLQARVREAREARWSEQMRAAAVQTPHG